MQFSLDRKVGHRKYRDNFLKNEFLQIFLISVSFKNLPVGGHRLLHLAHFGIICYSNFQKLYLDFFNFYVSKQYNQRSVHGIIEVFKVFGLVRVLLVNLSAGIFIYKQTKVLLQLNLTFLLKSFHVPR